MPARHIGLVKLRFVVLDNTVIGQHPVLRRHEIWMWVKT